MKKKILSYLFGIAIIIIGLSACKKETDTPDAPNTPDDNTTSEYVLTKHTIETQDPCFVNIMFQVSDNNGKGIDNLTTDNFQVLEDGQTLSFSESAMIVKKKDATDYSLKTVLMLDNSYSVGNNITEIKNAAISLVNSIVTDQEIAVYVFSENINMVQDFTNNVNSLTAAINSISLGQPSTNLYGAAIEGVSKWDDSYSTTNIKSGFMILITDGSDTQGSSSLSSAVSAIGSKRVYTVGVGSEIDTDALTQLGTADYYNVTNFSDLSAKFTEIQSDMSSYANSFYWLNYMSPKRGDNAHTLKLSVKDNQNTSSNSYIEGNFNSNGFSSVQQSVVINGGITTLTIELNESKDLFATTYLPISTPDYSWSSSNSSIVSVSVNSENSKATIIASGNNGEQATITVTDNSNSLSYSINVNVGNVCAKKVLIESFTAHKAHNCIPANTVLNDLLNTYSGQIIPISIHTGLLAEPSDSPFDVDYRTSAGNEIDNYFSISNSGLPSGMINRTAYNGNTTLYSNEWASAVSQELIKTSNIYIELSKTYNQSNKTVEINTKANFLSNVNSNLKIVVLLTEDQLISGQNDAGSVVSYYEHNHVLRAAITPSMGEIIGSNSIASGVIIEKDYTYTLEPEWVEDRCNIIVYIYNSDTNEIIQAEQIRVEVVL